MEITVRDIRAITGLSQAAFAERYGIPRRTLENWEAKGKEMRKPPEYVVKLLERVVREDFER